jgi:aminoglycoside phosphotransferase
MNSLLTAFQESRILSPFPDGSVITEASYFRNEYLPCPIKVSVQLPDHSQRVVVLRLLRHREASLAREAELLPILRAAGLPVPEVLAEPESDPSQPDAQPFAVYSFLAGSNCQTLAEESAAGSKSAIRLVVSAAETLAALTEVVRASVKSNLLPEITLVNELESFCVEGNIWLDDACVVRAVERLRKKLGQIESPLVFTNGDYQPANFLTDGEHLTGFVDFEYAGYQDFLYGFVKYPIYDLHPLNKAGLVAHLLEKRGVSPCDFAVRLALGCLKTLKREIPAEERQSGYCRHIFRLLESSMGTISNG